MRPNDLPVTSSETEKVVSLLTRIAIAVERLADNLPDSGKYSDPLAALPTDGVRQADPISSILAYYGDAIFTVNQVFAETDDTLREALVGYNAVTLGHLLGLAASENIVIDGLRLTRLKRVGDGFRWQFQPV